MIIGTLLLLLVGLSLGLLGGGGAVLAVPILTYVVGYDPKMAIAVGLLVVGLTSLLGAFLGRKSQPVRLSKIVPFGLLSMGGSYVGTLAAKQVPGTVQLLVLGFVMVASSLMMLRKQASPMGPGKTLNRLKEAFFFAFAGAGVGFLTGFAGVGGGFMFVPALVLIFSMPMKEAAASSLVLIAANSATALLGYLKYVELGWSEVAPFVATAFVGMIVGLRFRERIPAQKLRSGFAILLLVVAVFLISKNLLHA